MMSLTTIVGISIGGAGFAAFSRKGKPTLHKIGFFFLALIGMLAIMLAVNFVLYVYDQP